MPRRSRYAKFFAQKKEVSPARPNEAEKVSSTRLTKADILFKIDESQLGFWHDPQNNRTYFLMRNGSLVYLPTEVFKKYYHLASDQERALKRYWRHELIWNSRIFKEGEEKIGTWELYQDTGRVKTWIERDYPESEDFSSPNPKYHRPQDYGIRQDEDTELHKEEDKPTLTRIIDYAKNLRDKLRAEKQ